MYRASKISSIRMRRLRYVTSGQQKAIRQRLKDRYFEEYSRQRGDKISTYVSRVSSQNKNGTIIPASPRKADTGVYLTSGKAIGFSKICGSSPANSSICISSLQLFQPIAPTTSSSAYLINPLAIKAILLPIEIITIKMELGDQMKSELQCKFSIIRLLGKGAFGNVYECEDRADFERYAVKIISKLNVKRSKIENLKEEATLLRGMSHPNIVKIYEYGEFESCIYIKMEIAKAGTLQSLIEKKKKQSLTFTDDEVSKIMVQIFSGLSYIHSLNIIHRDIKPDNILLTNSKSLDDIKIADFGLSTKLDFHYPKSAIVKCGTMLFMAPEILCKYTYTKAIDIWSAAVIMYILFVGNHPIWKDKMTTEEYTAVMAKKAYFPEFKAHPLAQDFLSRISKNDPNERYTAQEGLKHPWMTRKFQDQIPLSVHESYSSFSTANETVKLTKIFMTLRCFCTLYRHQIPQDYLQKVRDSPTKQSHLRLRKLKSLNMDKKQSLLHSFNFGMDRSDQLKKKEKPRITSQSDVDNPTINKLNQIFNTLFDKKITSKTKMTYREKQPPSQNNQHEIPNIDSFKVTIEREIEQTVHQFLHSNRNRGKNRRILPVKLSPSKQMMMEKDEKIDLTLLNKGNFNKKPKFKKRNIEIFRNEEK